MTAEQRLQLVLLKSEVLGKNKRSRKGKKLNNATLRVSCFSTNTTKECECNNDKLGIVEHEYEHLMLTD